MSAAADAAPNPTVVVPSACIMPPSYSSSSSPSTKPQTSASPALSSSSSSVSYASAVLTVDVVLNEIGALRSPPSSSSSCTSPRSPTSYIGFDSPTPTHSPSSALSSSSSSSSADSGAGQMVVSPPPPSDESAPATPFAESDHLSVPTSPGGTPLHASLPFKKEKQPRVPLTAIETLGSIIIGTSTQHSLPRCGAPDLTKVHLFLEQLGQSGNNYDKYRDKTKKKPVGSKRKKSKSGRHSSSKKHTSRSERKAKKARKSGTSSSSTSSAGQESTPARPSSSTSSTTTTSASAVSAAQARSASAQRHSHHSSGDSKSEAKTTSSSPCRGSSALSTRSAHSRPCPGPLPTKPSQPTSTATSQAAANPSPKSSPRRRPQHRSPTTNQTPASRVPSFTFDPSAEDMIVSPRGSREFCDARQSSPPLRGSLLPAPFPGRDTRRMTQPPFPLLPSPIPHQTQPHHPQPQPPHMHHQHPPRLHQQHPPYGHQLPGHGHNHHHQQHQHPQLPPQHHPQQQQQHLRFSAFPAFPGQQPLSLPWPAVPARSPQHPAFHVPSTPPASIPSADQPHHNHAQAQHQQQGHQAQHPPLGFDINSLFTPGGSYDSSETLDDSCLSLLSDSMVTDKAEITEAGGLPFAWMSHPHQQEEFLLDEVLAGGAGAWAAAGLPPPHPHSPDQGNQPQDQQGADTNAGPNGQMHLVADLNSISSWFS